MKRMNILRLIALPVLLVAIVGCGGNKNKYTINGTLADEAFEGANVYMFDVENQNVKLDSTVVANGAFAFSGELETPIVATIVALTVDNKHKMMECVLENGTIVVDLDENKLSGTPLNEAFANMMNVGTDETALLQALYKEYLAAPSEEERKLVEAKYDSVLEIYTAKELVALENVFAENGDNVLGAYAFYQLVKSQRDAGTITSVQVDSILATAAPVVKNFSLTTKVLEGLRKLEKTSVGKPYTDLDLLEGEAMTATKLSQHIAGKVALIDFWASWCGPCRAEIPNIAEMHKKYADKGVVVIGLNVWDKPDAQRKTIETMNMTWLQLADTTKVATDTYGVNGIPQIMLIGKDGTILARDLRGEAIEVAIVEALK
ncbi:MAG: AhpC/TSA family protein [Bacteroidales bacterium]|nr:AhpC/TSA family protein [Bacteroidales bacterium]